LESAVRKNINFDAMDPFDALLLNDLIILVKAELVGRAGGDAIAAETQVAIVDVLNSVKRAAMIYVP
jgi:hypothetical protein